MLLVERHFHSLRHLKLGDLLLDFFQGRFLELRQLMPDFSITDAAGDAENHNLFCGQGDYLRVDGQLFKLAQPS